MNLINGKKVFLTGNVFDNGDYLNEIGNRNIYDNIQSKIYYDEGIVDFDEIFGIKKHYNFGYTFNIFATKNGIGLLFQKFIRKDSVDSGYAIIERSKIIGYETFNSTELIVEKKNALKNKTGYVLKNGMGLIGAIGGAISDNIIDIDTEIVTGYKFSLSYFDNKNERKTITTYCAEEFKNEIILFLNTYFKNELPPEAQKPIDENSSCFIATACYRDVFSKEVIFFRWYRDNTLNNYYLGRFFIRLYYKISPLIYTYLLNSPTLSQKIKSILDKIYKRLNSN